MTKPPLTLPTRSARRQALALPNPTDKERFKKNLKDKIQQNYKLSGTFAFLLDATASMASVISNTRSQIESIISRASERSGSEIKVRVYAYRDYDDPSTLLEKSDLTSDAPSLKLWLGRLRAMGGGDHEEAMEHALASAHEDGNFSGIFVVGDARARDQTDLRRWKPNQKTANVWAQEIFKAGTRVHSLWVPGGGGDHTDFNYYKQLAQYGGGSSGRLDGGEDILDMAVMAMISALKGTAAVESYAKDYHLTDSSRNFKALLIEHKK